MEMIELKDHKFFVGTQYHPEYLSKVLDPSRPFLGLAAAAAGILEDVLSRDDLNYKGNFRLVSDFLLAVFIDFIP